MAIILLFFLFITLDFDLIVVSSSQRLVWFFFLMPIISYMWVATSVAETNRAPFDFAEGESELVSGFNTEYGGTGFAIIFLAEYARILFMRMVSSLLVFGRFFFMGWANPLLLVAKTMFVSYAFLWVRASYPRYRYDLLMDLAWKKFLPFSLIIL